ENRQQKEQPQHATGKQTGQRNAGAPLERRHAGRRFSGHRKRGSQSQRAIVTSRHGRTMCTAYNSCLRWRMAMDVIRIRGARTHNLKNISLDLPRERLTVITGLSGSGKSSLAFDTLYAEGQRRYVESLSAYARQFLQLMDKPDVDLIEGLSPAISIEQKAAGHNPRSTVGTVTEIHDYLRLLYARVG